MSGIARLAGLIGIAAGAAAAATLGSVTFVRIRSRGGIYPAADVPHRPVGLVLGAQVHPDGRPSAFLRARLELARSLYRAGRVDTLLVSGDHRAPEYDEPRAMRTYLIARGLPAAAIVTDGGGLDTYDSCLRARQVFDIEALTVITQSYHLPRAVATARAVGLDAVGVGDDSVRAGSRSWRRGVVREQPACVKTVLDLLRGSILPPAPLRPGGADCAR